MARKKSEEIQEPTAPSVDEATFDVNWEEPVEETPAAEVVTEEQESTEPIDEALAGPDRSNLIKCTVERLFLDGNISDRFVALGYGRDEWKPGEVRYLTADVYQACISSGARLSIVAEG